MMEGRPSVRGYAVVLATLLGLFCLRVLGQLLVVLFGFEWLPQMEEWQSGLLPYPLLFASQVLIIALLGKVCLDFVRRHGFFVMPNPKVARFALPFGQIYFASMVVRYVVRMTLHPEARWFGGTIPIVFHWVLASYVMTLGHFHRTRTLPKVS